MTPLRWIVLLLTLSTASAEAQTPLLDPRTATDDGFSWAADPALTAAVEQRTALWQREFLSPLDDRARLLFVRGTPRARRITQCPEILRDVEIWEYASSSGAGPGERFVLFRPDSASTLRLWRSAEGPLAVYTREAAHWLEDWQSAQRRGRRLDLQVCKDASAVMAALALPGVAEGGAVVRLDSIAPPVDIGAWAREVAAEPRTTPPPDLGALGVRVEAVPLGLRGLVRVDLTLPDRALLKTVAQRTEGAAEGEPKRIYALAVEAAVERQGRVLEVLRARFELPVEDGATGPLALSLEPRLRAGDGYRLRFRVRDEQGGGESRASSTVDVPFTDPTALPPTSPEAILAEAQRAAVPLPGVDTLSLVPPDRDVLLGVWRAEAIVTGSKIRRVVFSLDDAPQLTRSGPPWTAELRLPSVPREIAVKAEGLDAANQVVAADTVVLNQVRGSLEVRLVEPKPGASLGVTFVARAELVVPDGRKVERAEFRLGDRLVATRTVPPWTARLETPRDLSDPLAFVGVTAILDDGSRAEDVRFLRGPENAERVEVDFVELYTTVVDRDGRPVTDLPESAFQVFEDGRRQKLARFSAVTDLPLTLGVVIDTSGSMLDSLGQARAAAAGFLRALVGPGDRAFAVRFAGKPQLVAARTPDADAVARSLETVVAEGSTALHDAIVHSLYYFRGTRGQRALVLLSDGDDTSSLVPFEQAIDIAQRSGVAIYAIGLKLSLADLEARRKLQALARETGGQAFFVGGAEELEGVYAAIEKELKSQYQLGYVSDAKAGGKSTPAFRSVEVKLTGVNGLKARTARGYYR
jgi:VWFA-related protein